ncbi:MAG: hypothetical protein J6S40_06550 [Thermoguttaceae bacterium]|nr:hypothetical protein [Thermoguttaceae bacterium]
MNSEKRLSLWAWLLLLSFGIPSIGSRGLHLFLSEEAGCSCHGYFESSSAEPRHASAGFAPSTAEETVFPVQAGPIPNRCDEGSCFLCHFLTQPLTGAAPALLLFAAGCISLIQDRPRPCLSAFPVFRSGRSPPLLFF